MAKELELFRMSDGFWAGQQTADKKRMKAGAHKITAEEIMTMFTEFFTDYCKEAGESKLIMQDGEGKLFVTMQAGRSGSQNPPNTPSSQNTPSSPKKPRKK